MAPSLALLLLGGLVSTEAEAKQEGEAEAATRTITTGGTT